MSRAGRRIGLGLGVLLGLWATGGGAEEGPATGPLDAGALPSGGLSAWRPTPPPGLGLSADRCAGCHAERHAEWASSAHASAWTDARFQVAWRAWPNGWCLNCHLPLAAQQRALLGGEAVPGALHDKAGRGDALAAEGVGCAVCHVRDGALVSAGAPSRLAQDAHPIARGAALTSGALCASCHQFPFQRRAPRHPFALSEAPLQDTVAEWAGSAAAAAGQGCADCHMPRGAHAMMGGQDLGALRRSIAVEVSAGPNGEAVVRLQTVGVGHKLPTGDPYRRITVELCGHPLGGLGQICENIVGEAIFRKVFAAQGDAWAVVDDTTVPAPTVGDRAERALSTSVSAPPQAWRARIDWVDPDTAASLPAEARGAALAIGRVEGAPRARRAGGGRAR